MTESPKAPYGGRRTRNRLGDSSSEPSTSCGAQAMPAIAVDSTDRSLRRSPSALGRSVEDGRATPARRLDRGMAGRMSSESATGFGTYFVPGTRTPTSVAKRS
jgi:hypothetical protein